MSAIAEAPSIALRAPTRPRPASVLLTLARRRASLTSKTPRQILVPLLGPALLALVVAPALKVATGGLHSHIDYTSFVGVGAVGLVIPLSCIFAGLSVLVDRHSGAQRELLAAPVPRAYLVLGNLIVALGLATLQVAVLIGLSALRGGAFHITGAGLAWFAPPRCCSPCSCTAWLRRSQPGQHAGGLRRGHPGLAILPFFFAGALYPIGAMPGVLTAIAKAFPLTHALALMRYGFIDPNGKGLHEIWGMHSVTLEAWLSLTVVAVWAVALTAISIHVFTRSAVN